jgi:hypothetical protein
MRNPASEIKNLPTKTSTTFQKTSQAGFMMPVSPTLSNSRINEITMMNAVKKLTATRPSFFGRFTFALHMTLPERRMTASKQGKDCQIAVERKLGNGRGNILAASETMSIDVATFKLTRSYQMECALEQFTTNDRISLAMTVYVQGELTETVFQAFAHFTRVI